MHPNATGRRRRPPTAPLGGARWQVNFGLLLLVVVVVAVALVPTAAALRCDRAPEGSGANKSPADGRFRLRISGNPDKYVPGESYTISLVGIRSMQVPHKFSGFFLAAEKEMTLSRPEPQNNGGLHHVGTFHLFGDALTKFSERCPNAVTQTSSIPKSEIQVNWIAPPAGSGCIAIRATVVEHRDVWYMDDGPLSKIFCEDEADSVDTQPVVLKECCACDEAKYELTFEGLWSRHTHPKDFPSNGWLTRFSDVIGASHTVDYRFWEYGQVASEGLKQVAEHGSTRMLESELKNQSDKIRTIIKARGISYPNVTGKTFAVFRVDSNHHLVSIVSMLDPSPDWIVGVSGLELCLTNCSWIENKILNLYPWDAGTDSGPTYISPDQPTNPPDAIRRIKSNYPNDPRSPFYDPSGAEMKPLARIILSRQRLYEKNCEPDEEENESKQACETEPWDEWTECSSRCGKGRQTRRRVFKYPIKAKQADCKKKLFERRPCVGPERDCEYQTSQEMDTLYQADPECEVTEWGPWSECSTPCGKGNKTRSRKYKKKGARKKCERMPNPPKLQQTVPCSEECAGDISQPVISSNLNPECKMSQWSEWGPCSVTCGLGRKMRTRMPLNAALNTKMHHRRFMNHYLARRRPTMNDDDEDDEGGEDDYDNGLNIDRDDPCFGEETVEEVTCGHDLPACDGLYGVPELCFLEPKPGNCRDSQTRWYFDSDKNDCSILFFTGCGGNNNNFMSREDCLDTCSKDRKFTNIPIRDQTIINSEYSPDFKQDCKTSHWKRGPCNVTCGEGFRVKSRTILVQPSNGGHRCPRKLRKLERCFIHCDSSRHDTNPSWGPSTRYSPEPIECDYSAWSAWSPCSRTCGDYAVQQRTRYVVNSEHARYCPHRLEERKCDIMPCLLGN